jgi:hypothetical protein
MLSFRGPSGARIFAEPHKQSFPITVVVNWDTGLKTDHNFILDRHPEAQNVWIVGGGSGHGFKHGPVMGEMIADAIQRQRLRLPK